MDWNELKQEIQSMVGIQPSDKERILSGWSVLEDCLGSGWFDEAASINHPWTLEFQNKAPWVKASFGIIGERISEISGIDGFEGILKKLKRR